MKYLALIFLATISINANATAYKCPEPDGSIAIRSIPCEDFDIYQRTGKMPQRDLPPESKPQFAPEDWSGPGKTRLNHDAVFCNSDQMLDRLTSLVGDQAAFTQLYNAAVASYQCRMAYEGQRLYLVNTHLFSGTAEVRYPGSPQIWWTQIEYVLKK